MEQPKKLAEKIAQKLADEIAQKLAEENAQAQAQKLAEEKAQAQKLAEENAQAQKLAEEKAQAQKLAEEKAKSLLETQVNNDVVLLTLNRAKQQYNNISLSNKVVSTGNIFDTPVEQKGPGPNLSQLRRMGKY